MAGAATKTGRQHDMAGRAQPVRIKASDLLAGHREVILQHEDQEYRLRLTSNGKLILTK